MASFQDGFRDLVSLSTEHNRAILTKAKLVHILGLFESLAGGALMQKYHAREKVGVQYAAVSLASEGQPRLA